MLYASNKCDSVRMKAIFKKNTITNENIRVHKKESIYEDVFAQKLLQRAKFIIDLVKFTLTDQ